MRTLMHIFLGGLFFLASFSPSPAGFWLPGAATQVSAQTLDPLSQSKKALKLFDQAKLAYGQRDYQRACDLLEKALASDPAFAEAYGLLGDIAAEQMRVEEAIVQYNKAVSLKPDMDYTLYVILGNLKLLTGKYAAAKQDYQQYLTYNKGPANRRWQTEENIRKCDVAIGLLSNPVPFNPVNLGDSINTVHDEYINAISSDQQTLFFTRRLPTQIITGNGPETIEEDFFLSILSPDSVWLKALNLGPPINTRGNEGAISISPDGQLLFFAACQRPDGYGSCDIYWSWKTGERWSTPRNLGPTVNSGAWDSQPSFSPDGKTLYFASKRGGGLGTSDIWKSILQSDGSWSVPENLGEPVNTTGEEQNPFIHPDDQTLYFASKGHDGMGGLDLFVTRKDTSGNWTTPKNLGYPINTEADEISLIVNATGDIAYISSDKLGGKGRQDIYAFPLYPEVRPNSVTYLKGIVFDKETGNRLQAYFELTDLNRNQVTVKSISDPVDGSFLVCLPTDRDYALTVTRQGYLFYSDHFSLTGIRDQARPFIRNIPLQPVKVGETVVLKNIFFDTDLFVLKPESFMELEKLLRLMDDNPSLQIEISGHTDNRGSSEHNMELSYNRAKAVYEYLLGKGIVEQRISFKGCGFTQPIDTNDTEEGRASNRRTEFRITGR